MYNILSGTFHFYNGTNSPAALRTWTSVVGLADRDFGRRFGDHRAEPEYRANNAYVRILWTPWLESPYILKLNSSFYNLTILPDDNIVTSLHVSVRCNPRC